MKQDLKNELHKMIDAIDDEETLTLLKEDLVIYTSERNTDVLIEEQLQELDIAIKEADSETDLQDWQSFKSQLESKWKEE